MTRDEARRQSVEKGPGAQVEIETKNLCLKGITLDYKDHIFREFTSEITTHMFPKPAERIEETIEFIETSMKENGEGSNFQIVILDKDNKNFLGCGGLHHIDSKTPELGIWIKKSAHGHGYGKEAMIALKQWADENLDYDYILYPVAVENYPSRKIPEFLGGEIAREYDMLDMSGKNQHLLEYRIYPPKD
ncbi:MAG: GNAT family N-acetyltransferase [Candidatus Uhrbacteria bacterium]